MAKKKRVIKIRAHPRRVPVSKKNPKGITIVDTHVRRLPGTYLKRQDLKKTFKKYNRKNLKYPKSGRLKRYQDKNPDQYDELIAVWIDYFHKKLKAEKPLDPNMVKALLGTESSFIKNPKANRKIALGIAQVTKKTLQYLQDPQGEVKQFIFTKIRQKDLADPSISIPLAVRWLYRKRVTAKSRLKKEPSQEDIAMEYKGLLKSKSEYKMKALNKFRELYRDLKRK